ncbi:MJ0042-type zinc finger domain-containing protein, partial [Paraburkholderia kirstenboschensis]
MLLATRCPFCETVFRLQPTQLALRRGLVRCGQCHEVFDASGSLFDISEGGDFSTARQVSAAAAIEALSGVRPSGADFSPAAWDPWAPRPTPLFE